METQYSVPLTMGDNGTHIYRGPWINWSRGRTRGATLTLSERHGGMLTAFLALFVTIAGGQLWRIVSFTIHQVRASPGPRDGLQCQQQAIFRNTTSPATFTGSFIRVAVHWWRIARRPIWRSLPWVVLGLVYLVASAVAVIFSSEVVKAAGNEALIASSTCGVLAVDELNSLTVRALLSHQLEDAVLAADYARTCYRLPSVHSQWRCNLYATPRIAYSVDQNASCPFAKGMCLISDTAALKMDSGLLNSHEILGINLPKDFRVDYRSVATCAPLRTDDFVESYVLTEDTPDVGLKGDLMYKYKFGQTTAGDELREWSVLYNNHTKLDAVGYMVRYVVSSRLSSLPTPSSVSYTVLSPVRLHEKLILLL